MEQLDVQPAVTAQPPVPPSIALGRVSRVQAFRAGVQRSWQLYVMLFLPLLWLLLFAYIPMWGVQIAFRNYVPAGGFAGIASAEWIGFEHFQRFFNSYNFWPILKNTLILNLYSLIAGFPLPIILALALNYIRNRFFKKTVQMVSYAPHFISVVVMVGILFQILASGGMLNNILGLFGIDPILWMNEPQYWKSIYVWSGVWQNLGFSCIIYLAALAGIDPTLHEAAILDGANKLQRMRDIDLPGIMPVALILLILNMGSLLSTGFEKVILMQNPLNLSTSEVIDTYVYRVSLASDIPQFAYGAAIGLFKSVIGLILIVSVNRLAKRFQGTGLW
jgi:multiple sugar transport system permease protein/putative aldouronate transport system permease protein